MTERRNVPQPGWVFAKVKGREHIRSDGQYRVADAFQAEVTTHQPFSHLPKALPSIPT